VTARLRSLAAGWRGVTGLDDATLAKRIRGDGIDVLIETSGVTLGHRLGVMAMRPAPVQATWCGYPATTGLSEVDYRIVDSKTDPVGAEKWCVERLVRIDPCFLCYGPGASSASEAPITQTGDRWHGRHVTFGSFNAGMKLNAKVIGVWARLLKRVPGSGLILKAFDFKDAPTRKRIEDAFVAEGVEAGRVEVMPPVATAAEHLRAYERVDIALDTFPYAGTTTTFEALWMGVPVVTLAGKMHAGRVGVSILENVGLGDCVATSEDEYVELAARLAGDATRRAELRGTLRERVRGSAACDGAEYSKRFGEAVRGMWTEWCGGAAG